MGIQNYSLYYFSQENNILTTDLIFIDIKNKGGVIMENPKSTDVSKYLNDLGADRWELVSLIGEPGLKMVYVFKRPTK